MCTVCVCVCGSEFFAVNSQSEVKFEVLMVSSMKVALFYVGCSTIFLIMEAASVSETLVNIYQTTWFSRRTWLLTGWSTHTLLPSRCGLYLNNFQYFWKLMRRSELLPLETRMLLRTVQCLDRVHALLAVVTWGLPTTLYGAAPSSHVSVWSAHG